MTKYAIVIGAGVSGLAIAIRMAKKGYSVSVFEKNETAGGKLGELKMNGFRFDTGPSLLTLPNLLHELSDGIPDNRLKSPEIVRLDNICKYFFADGTLINAWSDPVRFAKEVADKTTVPAKRILRFLNENKVLYQLTSDLFLFSPFQKLRTFFRREIVKIGFNLHRLKMLRTMHSVNARFFTDPQIVQLFDRYATYNGSNPYQAPATLNMIAHLEHNTGAFLPSEGMYSIVRHLIELCEYYKVKINFRTPVTKVLTESKAVIGVVAGGKTVDADIVINATDINYAKTHLFAELSKRIRSSKIQYSTSAYIFYWGIDRKYKNLDIHNILFSSDYRAEFEALFSSKTVYHDPTVYIYISSKINPADAPNGCENWFVMVNAPSIGQNSEVDVNMVKNYVVEKIRNTLDIAIDRHIVTEGVRTPETIQTETNSVAGAIYGASSNSIFSAFLRQPNFSRRIKGLYFTGGSVHPGGGIPLCLASAKIVANLNPDISE